MSTRMLIDARHEEETRVTVVKGNRIEEFDYESSSRKQLKGNIYLAKVTRVEPSLQAAFVEYGGNRHGFLAFSEIHPDYYQIPVEDREALLAEARATADKDTDEVNGDANDEVETQPDEAEEIAASRDRKLAQLRRKYRIQEVIKRRQILLVQVVKEERGTKGAALTTYLSLAGRYCVLMPNSEHGGGISRKIANQADRKRLKTIMTALEVPDGMGCIIRTAGLQRTKTEIKRDFDYLLRLWEGIREQTLKSIAPCLIHEEASLIKRSIRDLYTRDIDEVLVEGETGYRSAKDFMRMLMPSHAKKVQHYKDRIPLFHRYQVEQQLDSMYNATVEMRSGGYIVINQTEALVAIDVNSGRSTREHNIEETALKTNLEAADEVARQLRLRDLAGLIVIDFIDMEERNNNRQVERRLKEALKSDRARIQVGRISSFGLLEMSRQRLRPTLLEASMIRCEACEGTGVVRSTESRALRILRHLEEEGIRERSEELTVYTSADVALYLLNKKRGLLAELEDRYDLRVQVLAADDKQDLGAEGFSAERLARGEEQPVDAPVVRSEERRSRPAPAEAAPDADEASSEGDSGKRKRRRRRRRKRPDEAEAAPQKDAAAVAEEPASGTADAAPEPQDPPKRRRVRRKKPSADKLVDVAADAAVLGAAEDEDLDRPAAAQAGQAEEPKPKRRRVRRKKPQSENGASPQAAAQPEAIAEGSDAVPAADAVPAEPTQPAAQPAAIEPPTPVSDGDGAAATAANDEPAATKRAPSVSRDRTDVVLAQDRGGVEHTRLGAEAADASQKDEQKKKRRGWWNRVVGS